MNKKIIGLSLLISSIAYAYTTTSNMSLRIPSTGETDYPTSISNSFTSIDAHDHSSGKGVQIPAGGLASDSVTTAKILDTNVTAGKLADSSVTTAKVADLGITAAKMAVNSVGTANIIDANVTSAKLASNLNLPGTSVQENSKNIVVSNTNAAASLAIIRATTNGATSVTVGEGISSITRLAGAGVYELTWTTPFASTPVVVASLCAASSTITIVVYTATTTKAQVSIFDSSLTNVDKSFSIIAIGQTL